MEDRRVHTEECFDDGLSEDEEFYKRQLEFYVDSDEEGDDYGEEDEINHNEYKGIYIDDEPGQKFEDPKTGAHFDYQDIYEKLLEVEIEKSQERDPKTVKKNKELLKIQEENEDSCMNNQLFKTEDNTLQKSKI